MTTTDQNLETAGPVNSSRPFWTPWAWAGLFFVLLGFLLRVWAPGTIYFNIHAERDYWRTLQILQGEALPYTGSEMTQGGRTMGPALYLLQIPPLLITKDPRGLLVWLAILHAGALWLTFLIGRENFSEKTGLAATALFATYPLAALALRYVWNPSFIFPLSCLFWWCLADWVLRGRTRRFPLMVLTLVLLSQIHLSSLLLVLIAFLTGLLFRAPFAKKPFLIGAAIVIIGFSPYIVGEITTGFSNTEVVLTPPERLETANEAELPLLQYHRQRFALNKGAMRAFQTIISPVFYDMRFPWTGNFSYLHLLGEFGPEELPPPVFRIAFFLHQTRWLYILAYLAILGLLFWTLATQRDGGMLDAPGESRLNARRKAGFLLIAFFLPIIPMMFTMTLGTVAEGKTIAVGAVRYFFILFPMQYILLALLTRWAWKQAGRLIHQPGRIAVASILGIAVFLQGFALAAYIATAVKMDRVFKYGLQESIPWSTIEQAAEVLIEDYGVSPSQFVHRVDTVDYLFNTQRWDRNSLEQGLDWAYYVDNDLPAQPKYPDSYFLIADLRRSPGFDTTDPNILESRQVDDLLVMRLAEGERHKVSPIQNTWVKIREIDD